MKLDMPSLILCSVFLRSHSPVVALAGHQGVPRRAQRPQRPTSPRSSTSRVRQFRRQHLWARRGSAPLAAIVRISRAAVGAPVARMRRTLPCGSADYHTPSCHSTTTPARLTRRASSRSTPYLWMRPALLHLQPRATYRGGIEVIARSPAPPCSARSVMIPMGAM